MGYMRIITIFDSENISYRRDPDRVPSLSYIRLDRVYFKIFEVTTFFRQLIVTINCTNMIEAIFLYVSMLAKILLTIYFVLYEKEYIKFKKYFLIKYFLN